MRIKNYEQHIVNDVSEQMPYGTSALYRRNISASNRYSLANAAAAAGVSTDELMAVMDYRARRRAATAAPVSVLNDEVEHGELELA
jgi:hypothetical protein